MRVVTLQAADECDGHRSGKIRIFSVRFFAAPPARIARQVRVGSADDDALPAMLFSSGICGAQILALKNIAGFIAFDGRGLLQQIGIPGFTESYGLRKLRGRQRLEAAPLPPPRAAVGNTVQTFDVSRAANSQA